LLSEEVMLTLLVSLTFVSTYADGNCCPKKYVHGEWYTFVKIDPNAKTEFGCLDNCVYQNDDSMGLVCFKKGEYMSKCVEETVSLGGCLGKEDRIPKAWIPLLNDPCKYLNGPKCNSSSTKEEIGIVGAGMAGLTMAYLLNAIGYKVTILEKTDRHGGRAYTYKGNGWYGDLGAMRFPPRREMPLIWAMFDLFNITEQLETFTNTNEGDSSYLYIDGKYFPYKDFERNDQKILEEIYKIFGIKTNVASGTFPRNKGGKLVNPSLSAIKTTYDLTFPDLKTLCIDDKSLRRQYEKALKEKFLPTKLIDIWSIINLERAFLPYSGYQGLFDTPEEHQIHSRVEGGGFYEIKDGVSVLPDTIVKGLDDDDFSLIYGGSVTSVKITEDKQVHVVYKTEPNLEREAAFDKVVMTPTATAMSLMKFSPPLPYEKNFALNSYNYMNSVKVFLAFKTPFWQGNSSKIPSINFDQPGVKGGSGVTDLPCSVIYYPSHPFHGNSLLASYVWGRDADRLTAFNEEAVIKIILENLVKIHGKVAEDQYLEGKVINWYEEDWTVGAFPWAYPGQFQEFGGILQDHFKNKIFFAGEYTSKFDHGWIQAAVESACRVSKDMFGNGTPLPPL